MLNYNLLQKSPEVEYINGDFPHFVIEDPLNDDGLYYYLSTRFPSLVCDGEKENKAVRMSCLETLGASFISPVWKSLFTECVSGKFLYELLKIFETPFVKHYGDSEYERITVSHLSVRNKSLKQNLTTDCQFVINTPTNGGTSVRGPHFDSTRKLYALCWYFRDPADNSAGGDFGLYRHKGGKFRHDPQNQISDDDVELIKTVEYKQNVLVGFMNSKHSIHGVTVRDKSEYPRRYINVIAEQRKPLFKT